MTNTLITTGIYPGTTYVHYYNLTLDSDSNVFLEVSNDNGTSAVYNSQMQLVGSTSEGDPIHLLAGSYIIKASYSSPTHAVMNVYIPSDYSYESLTDLATGSYKANSYDNFYSLHLENSGELFITASGDSAVAKIYDKELNYLIGASTAPIYLNAGDYIIHAQYNGYKNGVLNTYIPEELTSPAPESQTLIGTSANEAFNGGTGNDSIDGRAGIDTASYSVCFADYTITMTSNSWTVHATTGTDGTDTLTNIERLQFSDKNVALDITDNALETLQFIGVIAPELQNDLAVRGVILNFFDQGYSMEQLCQLALDLGLAPTDNTVLANAVYHNVLGGTPSQDMSNALVSYIEQNGDANFLATVAGMNLNVDLVGLQQHGMEYL